MPRAITMNHRAGMMLVNELQPAGETRYRKDHSGEKRVGHHGAQQCSEHRRPLRRRARSDEHSERETDHRVENAGGKEKENAAAERHMEDQPRCRCGGGASVGKSENQVWRNLSNDDVPGPERRPTRISMVPRSFLPRDSEIAVLQ